MPFRPRYTGLIDKYRDRLPVHDDTRVSSLGEGNTPVIRLNNVPREIGKDVDVYVKYEGLNRTASFKDRGMTKAVEDGSQAVICASTGNTSASAAAYAARAGITAFVLIPEGSAVVCTLTGHGLKDPDAAIKQCDDTAMLTVGAELEPVRDAILSNLS